MSLQKLFAQAWLSSGSAIFPGEPLVESEYQTQIQYIHKLNCKERDAACLRSLVTVFFNIMFKSSPTISHL